MDLFSIVLFACVAIAAFWIGSRVINFLFYYLVFRGVLLYALPYLERHGVHNLTTIEYYLTAFLITMAISIVIEKMISGHPMLRYLIWAATAYVVITHFNLQSMFGMPNQAMVQSAKTAASGVLSSTKTDATQYMNGKNFLGIAINQFITYFSKLLGFR